MRIKDTATTVETVWDSLKGAFPRLRAGPIPGAWRRVRGRFPAGFGAGFRAGFGKALDAAWPLVAAAYRRANSFLRGHLPTALVLMLGVLISGTGFLLANNFYQNRSQQAFDRPAAHYTAIFSQAIDRYLEVINSVGTFMAASNEVDRWEFFALVGKSLPRFPGIRALVWIPRVPAEKRGDYEKQGQKDGLYGFGFTEKDSLGNIVPARERDEYYPVYYVEPFEGNQTILGFDLASSRDGRRILDRARDTGQMIAAQQVALVQADDDQAAFLTVLPIYDSRTEPATIADRRKALVGFVLGVFRFSDMIEVALRNFASADALEVYLYDTAARPEERLIFFHPSPLRRDSATPLPEDRVYAGPYSATAYDAAGREWSIVVKPAPGYFVEDANLVSWGVVAVGLLLTALLLQYLLSSASRTRVIEQSVAQRTAELLESNEALEAEIRERKRAERERVSLERELAQIQKMESLGTLAGGIAHEINSPVQYVGENLGFLRESMAGLSRVLRKYGILAEAAQSAGVLSDEVAEVATATEAADLEFLRREMPASIDQSLEGIERISEIVRAIREFSHPDAKEMIAIDINHAIATTLTVANNQIKYVADVETDLDESLPPVSCLPGELNQVILNLLVNAAHAIEETASDRRGRITVTTRNLGDRVEIRIGDTGTGIPEAIRKKIFDPFFTTKEPGKGTGQGLAISHTIITKKHGGTIDLETEPGKGTTFIIRLPLEAPDSSYQGTDGTAAE
ncbi:MAG: CHASE domain-containing protein [Proteobacteria bacterium]|nr:CHASE domain-containing protein [Pseudomonadota bacterium]